MPDYLLKRPPPPPRHAGGQPDGGKRRETDENDALMTTLAHCSRECQPPGRDRTNTCGERGKQGYQVTRHRSHIIYIFSMAISSTCHPRSGAVDGNDKETVEADNEEEESFSATICSSPRATR